MEASATEIRTFIAAKFEKQGDFKIFPPATFDTALSCAIEAEEGYMQAEGIYDGKPYDDEIAFNRIYRALCEKLPNEKMYLMRFAEDYMDYSEAYLESIGAIEWD